MKIITLICLLLFLFYDSNGQNIEMVQVEGGSFSREGVDITISSFKIGKYEVTQKQYEDVMGGLPEFPHYNIFGKGDEYPMYYVSYFDAIIFCNELTRNVGMGESQQCYYHDPSRSKAWKKGDPYESDTLVYWDHSKSGYRLPTEAEWEYAARGGNQSKNYQYSGCNETDSLVNYAWYRNNNNINGFPFGAKEVGTRRPNELGIHDMSGNVCEWCFDYWSGYSEAAQCNPVREVKNQTVNRVIRGGFWLYNAESCRVAIRRNTYPTDRDNDIGFRLVSQ